jgi:heavy metal sensor kinase
VTVISRLPIRLRLTLWYAAVVAVALSLFGSGLYFGLRHYLYASLDDTLRSEAALTVSSLSLPLETSQLGKQKLTNPQQGEQFIRLIDRSGHVVADASAGFDTPPSDPAGLATALDGHETLHWISVGGKPMRVLSEPVRSGGNVVEVLQVGLFANEVRESLDLTVGISALLGPLVLVLISVGGIWVARRSLAPVVRIADLAAEIEAQDLSRRIDPGLAQDELGRLASTFNAILDRIEAAFRRQQQFTADASHELRTPLALLQSQIENALAAPRDGDTDQKVLEALAQDVERLTRIATALLSLARSDAGTIRLNYEEINLPEILDIVAEQYAPLAGEAGVNLKLDTRPVQLIADEDRLVQLLVNLLDNALRHTPAGDHVILGCRGDASCVQIWVTDSGVGIAAEHVPHIFERFYRADPARSNQSGSVGLGLNICQMIVSAHGGTIKVASVVGEGTTVTVVLPQSNTQPAEAPLSSTLPRAHT